MVRPTGTGRTMPRRPPGVYKRGSTWSVVIDHRDPATRARRKVWHSGYATMAEAAEARIRLLRERDTGRAVPASKLTVGQYLLDGWLPERMPAPGDGMRSGSHTSSRYCPTVSFEAG